MPTDQEVATGLFDWINSLHVSDEVASADDLKDGTIVWEVLQHIDRFSFPGDLPEKVETDQWVHRWTNLKHIYDALSIFLLEECVQNMPLRVRPDLKAIAQSACLVDTILLVKLVVVAAINCSDRIKYLENMQTLVVSTQEVLMTTAQEADEAEEDDGDDGDDLPRDAETPPLRKTSDSPRSPRSPRSAAPDVDSDLASEERLGKVIADNQRIAHEKRDLQNQINDLHGRFTKLQAAHDQNLDESKEASDRLTAILAGTADSGRHKSSDAKQESVIAALETRIIEAEEVSDQLRKSNEVLRIKAERVQKLQDDFDEMKSERDRLSRRANAAEKYKQKLEAIQEVEKENASLRAKNSELQSQIKQSDSSQVSSSDLAREVDEYRRLLPSIEQERHELNEMKKRLELDFHVLEARHQDTLEQFARQQSSMEDLQGRLRDYEDGITHTPMTPKANGAIEAETLEEDFAENEKKLTDALMGEETDEDGNITEDELRAIISAMRAQAESESTSDRTLSHQIEEKLLSAVQRSHERKRQFQDHIQKQSAVIASLQASTPSGQDVPLLQKANPSPPLEAIASRPATPSSEARLQEALALNENLRRELRLMTSAWYDQNSRLMSNGALLMRGRASAEPRGFLGKQRKLVERVMLGTSGSP